VNRFEHITSVCSFLIPIIYSPTLYIWCMLSLC
jgi:hypothetical protein